MALTIRPLAEQDLTGSFVHMLNRTTQKLVKRSFWSVPLLRRLFFRRTELKVTELLHLVTSTYQGKEYHLLLVNYRDVMLDRPEYGWDVAGRWFFYDQDLLAHPPFAAIKKSIDKVATANPIQWLSTFVPKDMPEEKFVKGLKGNYNSLIYGDKSKLYIMDNMMGLSATHTLTEAVVSFGIQRHARFVAEGQVVMPELYDLPYDFAGIQKITAGQSGVVAMRCQETNDLIGCLSFYAQSEVDPEKDGELTRVLYLHELVLDPDPKWKPLSAGPVLHIQAINYFRIISARGNGPAHLKVNLGYNTDPRYNTYKEMFRPTTHEGTIYTGMHATPGIPLSCFKE